ncbi:alpha/beta-hydrolase [Thozetella sp. PMI_491]|nr:alpha/beta-hydrolase [Thozetella sp. PMI_491]
MASHPPSHCCTVGFQHEGEPTGTSFQLGKWEAYLATPDPVKAHPRTAILYVPDVLGVWANSKLIADHFAAKGYLCLIIDVLNGDPLKLNSFMGLDLTDWLNYGSDGKNPHTPEHVDPIMLAAIEYLKTQKGVEKIGAVGYCFGARYVARHFRSGISVGYFAHPSFVQEEELAAISGPLSIAASDIDDIFTAERRHRSEEILRELGQPWEIKLYGGVEHGFAARGDMSKKTERLAKERSFEQAVAWFDDWLL